MENLGRKTWVFPDAELPPEGEGVLKGHESVIILNMTEKKATVKMTFYFTDKDPIENLAVEVDSKRVRCIRINYDPCFKNVKIPQETQYAIRLDSDVPIVAQYGRLDNRQANLAYYTVMGYSK